MRNTGGTYDFLKSGENTPFHPVKLHTAVQGVLSHLIIHEQIPTFQTETDKGVRG